ncbi:MAG: riboflavin biosynthesis protein RibF [Alicyclobacillaceae bacterium]|nr:riboflavin biosynthesis protein RibF [Alicyclobacillaceae bacterium]
MEVVDVKGRPPASRDLQVLAIGKFDGIHVGHQKIIRAAHRLATAGDEPAGVGLSVMLFYPHPEHVLLNRPGYDRWLTPFPEQCELLAALGVHRVYRVHFTPAYAAISAEEFVRQHLAAMNLKTVVIGDDFRFGRGGAAGPAELQRLCRDVGISVQVVSPVRVQGAKVSSSQIRAHLEHGRVEAAEALLGRPYAVSGVVVHGDALGRKLGFPTANLGGIEEYVLPGNGVYAVAVSVSGEEDGDNQWFGVLNAGRRPTVSGRDVRLEVHLLGFSGDLYGQRLRVSFLHRIRDEMRFASVEELKSQIGQDVRQVEEMVGNGELVLTSAAPALKSFVDRAGL